MKFSIKALSIITTLSFGLQNISQAQNVDSQSASIGTPARLNVSYQDVLSLEKTNPDYVVRYGDGEYQFGELRLPKNQLSAKPPLVIFIHGGCWLSSFDVSHIASASAALVNAGYAVLSLEYRRTGNEGGGWPNTLGDILAGIRHAMSAGNAHYDNQKIAIVGHSAGGHLALLAGAKLHDSKVIRSVIGLSAITDIVSYSRGDNSCQKATTKFMGGTEVDNPRGYVNANPIEAELHPKTVLLQAGKDLIVGLDQNLPNHKSILIEGAGHFDMIHPQTNSFKALLKQLANDL